MTIWRSLATLLALALLSLLSACNTIEHRSEEIPKQALPKLSQGPVPHTLWSSSHTKGDNKNDVKLRLAVHDNAIISADGFGRLFAQDRNSGSVLWHIKDSSAFSAGPTVIQNAILMGTRDAFLRAYDTNDGHLLWNTRLSGEVLAAPKGYRGVAYVKTQDGSVVAVKMDDGQVLWRYNLHMPPLVLRQSSSPVITEQHVFVGFPNGRLVAIQRHSGIVDWERDIATPKGRSDIQRMADISADPLVINNTVYVVSYQGRLAAVSEDEGHTLWEKEFSSFSGLELVGSKLFLADAKGYVYALDKSSGETLWEQKMLQGRHLSKPVAMSNKLAIGDNEGNLHYISQNNGEYLNRIFLDKKGIQAPPLVIDNKLYVLGRGGKIAVLSGD